MTRLLLLLALLSTPALADMVAVSPDGDIVRLTQAQCGESVLRLLPEGTRGHFRQARVRFQGLDYLACWAVRGDGLVHVQYSDGDAGLIPIRMFRQEPDT